MNIRRATRSDLEAIVAMLADDELGRRREDTSLPLNSRYTSAFEAIDRDPQQHLAVAERDGSIVGCVQVTIMPTLSHQGMFRGQIESVRIAACERGTGLGRTMIAWAIDYCRERGCGMVQLTSDKSRGDAIRFYERLGFGATHEGMKMRLDGGDRSSRTEGVAGT
jgi:ribosomal protein S18 acetylase RimI-like enzyme